MGEGVDVGSEGSRKKSSARRRRKLERLCSSLGSEDEDRWSYVVVEEKSKGGRKKVVWWLEGETRSLERDEVEFKYVLGDRKLTAGYCWATRLFVSAKGRYTLGFFF